MSEIDLSPLHEGEGKPQVVETRAIGHSTVTFVGIEHDRTRSEYPIRDFLQQADKVVLEYFRPDLKQSVFDVPIAGDIAQWYADGGIAQLSQQAGAIAEAQGKNIVVVDPANSLLFALASKLVPGAVLGVGLGTLTPYALRLFDTIEGQPSKLKRRDVLKLLGGSVATLAGIEGTFSPVLEYIPNTQGLHTLYRDESLNEKDMRWVTIAEGIERYCTIPENHHGKLAVIYPPSHIVNGILPYIDNPGERAIKNAIYAKTPGLTRAIREYQPIGQNQWTPLPPQPIQ